MLASPALPMLSYQVCRKQGHTYGEMTFFFLNATMTTKEKMWYCAPPTCLKVFLDSLQEVSTVNFVLKMLQSLAPYPLRPPKEQDRG